MNHQLSTINKKFPFLFDGETKKHKIIPIPSGNETPLLNMAIEIVDFPSKQMVIFHFAMLSYQMETLLCKWFQVFHIFPYNSMVKST